MAFAFMTGLLQLEKAEQFVYGNAVMRSDVLENAGESARLDWRMARNYLVVLPALLRRYANMRAFLSRYFVAEEVERLCQLAAVDVAGQFHAAITSSCTKCKRMSLGASAAFSK